MKITIANGLAISCLAIFVQGCVYAPPRYIPASHVYPAYSPYPAYGYSNYGYSSGYYAPSIGLSIAPSFGYGGRHYGGNWGYGRGWHHSGGWGYRGGWRHRRR